MNYIYFVSFTHSAGSGNAEVLVDSQEITNIEQLRFLEKGLAEKHNVSNVVITNYILLRKERGEGKLAYVTNEFE